jgi:1-hydroxycarotenoid 3,4-desaturase
MSDDKVVIVGAGIGGLACAIDLAARGFAVEVIERARSAGGKMRQAEVAGLKIDCGPTVFTMRWAFDELFESAGAEFDRYVTLSPLDILARHAWNDRDRFDLFADLDQAADAVARFSGPDEGRRFLAFCAEAKAIYRTLKQPFLASSRPGPVTLTRRVGFRRLPELFGIRPFETLWGALSKHFTDPRLRQLFGRYATYNGSSPFSAPATLMLIAHVEQDGVWAADGGMQRIADAMHRLAGELGVAFRFGQEVREICLARDSVAAVRLASGERIEADRVVVNADAAALAAGLFGAAVQSAVPALGRRDRSLSAVTWALVAKAQGFPLLRHNVFFSEDYAAEFNDLFMRSRLPVSPTVYVCAQDRGGRDDETVPDPDRLLMLVNAPPTGDTHHFAAEEIAQCEARMFSLLKRCGLSTTILPDAISITNPADFHRLFPGTGGALYGRASHGWMASFRRPESRTRIPGLYLAGGSTHPGAGVPMAALSGRLAARRLLADRASIRRFHPVVISGGISMA